MRTMLAAAALVAVALAGCSDDHAPLEQVTCPDGTMFDPETAEGHHEEGFDPVAACPAPPSVTLEGLPAVLGAYVPGSFTWTVDPGAKGSGHSMLSSVRYSASPLDAADLADDPTVAGTEVARMEHQEVPASFNGTLRFEEAGTYFLRAYAQVDGRHVWSDEFIVNVTAVQPTGTTVVFTKAVGGPAGEMTPAEADLDLGDAIQVKNDDVLDHTFTLTGPGPDVEIAAGRLAASEEHVMLVPGTYTLTSDDVQAKSVTFTVALPA